MAPKVTASEAAAGVARITGLGKQRRSPPTPPSTARAMREETVHVFNVGPWGYREPMGSLGWFFIPACEEGAAMEWERVQQAEGPKGTYVPDVWVPGKRKVKDPKKEYAAVKPIPGLVRELVPTEVDQNEWREDDGRYFANELLGIGIGHSKRDSKVRRGCFVAAGQEPTDRELAAARKVLEEDYMAELIREARTAHAAGPQRAEAIIRPEIHHVAAYWLGLKDEVWLRAVEAKGRLECPVCGTMSNQGVLLCRECGYIYDKDKHAQLVKEGRIAA